MNAFRSVVRGTGSALPKTVVTNRDLEARVDTSDEWIQQRTGIKQRYIAGEGETTVSLGEAAARRALEAAGLVPDDIDLVIWRRQRPTNTFPASSTQIQRRLGITKGFAFDVQAVCSGFVYALTTADLYLKSGMARRALVIGARPSAGCSTGPTARPASCSAMAPARSCWSASRAKATVRAC